MSFDLTILGSNSAVPNHQRHPSSQFLRVRDHGFLIDCGEGVQMQLKKYGLRHSKINHIYISHLHGDHFFGLPGLISTMNLYGRKTDLFIFGPKGLVEILTTIFKYSQTVLSFPIHFVELDTESPIVIFENEWIEVSTIPLKHRIECCGFLFREKAKKRRIRSELIPSIKSIGPSAILSLKNGEDVLDDNGKILFENSLFTLDPAPSLSYAYCSDTKYSLDIIQYINGVDLLYHEATFANEHADRALMTFHSTAEQAATIAKNGEVKKLLIGHFSNRYKELHELLQEAKSIFDSTELAIEGRNFRLS